MGPPSWNYYKELTWLFNNAPPLAAPLTEEEDWEWDSAADEEQFDTDEHDQYHYLFNDPIVLITLLGE